MNYYERFVGDFQRDTGHLTCAEVGIFDRFLDHYYATEKPLPSDKENLFRICRAMNKSEKISAIKVADEFFPIATDGLRHNARADSEIQRAQARITASRENGRKRKRNPVGIPAGSQQEPSGQARSNPAKTQPGIPHTPYTSSKPIGAAAAEVDCTGGGENTGDSPPPAFQERDQNPSTQGFADRLNALEACRGMQARFKGAGSGSELLEEWVAHGVTYPMLQDAHRLAVMARNRDKDKSPLNPGFLSIFVQEVLDRPSAAGTVTDARELVCAGLRAKYRGQTMIHPDGRRFELSSDGYVALIWEDDNLVGSLSGAVMYRFWEDVESGFVTPAIPDPAEAAA